MGIYKDAQALLVCAVYLWSCSCMQKSVGAHCDKCLMNARQQCVLINIGHDLGFRQVSSDTKVFAGIET